MTGSGSLPGGKDLMSAGTLGLPVNLDAFTTVKLLDGNLNIITQGFDLGLIVLAEFGHCVFLRDETHGIVALKIREKLLGLIRPKEIDLLTNTFNDGGHDELIVSDHAGFVESAAGVKWVLSHEPMLQAPMLKLNDLVHRGIFLIISGVTVQAIMLLFISPQTHSE